MNGKAMSPELNLRRNFGDVRGEKIATNRIERNDGLAIVLCHQQKRGVE
jgi:hypothetical protein